VRNIAPELERNHLIILCNRGGQSRSGNKIAKVHLPIDATSLPFSPTDCTRWMWLGIPLRAEGALVVRSQLQLCPGTLRAVSEEEQYWW
jgi:hypothetical protein